MKNKACDSVINRSELNFIVAFNDIRGNFSKEIEPFSTV